MAKRLWFARTRRILTQYGIVELRDRLAQALAELRRVRRERDALLQKLDEAHELAAWNAPWMGR